LELQLNLPNPVENQPDGNQGEKGINEPVIQSSKNEKVLRKNLKPKRLKLNFV
jgi:hypothetical protein